MSYGLSPIPTLENRVHEKLVQFSASTELEKERLHEAERLVLQNSHVQDCLKGIQKVTNEKAPKVIGSVGALARKIGAFAEETQERSARLRKLHVLLERAHAARVVADALCQIERMTKEIESAREERDLPRIVAQVLAYEAAQEKLFSAFPLQANTSDEGAPSSSTSSPRIGYHKDGRSELHNFFKLSNTSTVETVREECVKMLSEKIHEAEEDGDRPLLLSSLSFLVQLGKRRTATEALGRYLSRHVIHALLTQVVEVELAKMDTPHAALSHLVLLSRMLEAVAGTLEAEDPVIRYLLSGVKDSSRYSKHNSGNSNPAWTVSTTMPVSSSCTANEVSPVSEEKTEEAIVVDEHLFHSTRGVLLEILHKEATAASVKIVEDFFQRRKGVIVELREAVDRHQQERNKHPGPSGSFTLPTASHPSSGISSGSLSSSTSTTSVSTATTLALISRRADQLLEDISHITSCCHVYFEFYTKNALTDSLADDQTGGVAKGLTNTSFHSNEGRGENATTTHTATIFTDKREGGDPSKDDGKDYLWFSMDNPLLLSAQQLLSMFCSVQLAYLEFAFSQALTIQRESIDEKVRSLRQLSAGGVGKPRGNGKGMSVVPTTTISNVEYMDGGVLFSHLREMYEQPSYLFSSSSSADMLQADLWMTTERVYYLHKDLITLPEDVFYVLRIALQRAFHTKSTQVLYAVLTYITDILQSSLTAEIERQVRLCPPVVRRREEDGERPGIALVAPRVLRWICAAHTSAEYTLKLSEELLRLGTMTYTGGALERLKAQATDFNTSGDLLKQKVQTWLSSCAKELWNSDDLGVAAVRKLKAQDYLLTEEQLFFFEIHDPWAQALLLSSEEALTEMHKVLDQDTFDQFLIHFSQVMVKKLREILATKKFNTIGALQLDKEVRGLRFFFSNVSEKAGLLRDIFSPLSLTATLLLVETPRDALDELHNTSLTGKEKKQILLQRVEFNEEEVLSLRI